MTVRFAHTGYALWLAAVLAVAGCETSLEVYGDDELHFSLLGYLDASADTQWVRVEALKDSLLTGAKPLSAVLTMTHLATGRRVVWRDSLFHYSGGATAHNFWTTEPVRPRETYRLDVVRADGAGSSVTVVLPDDFPDPFIDPLPFFTPRYPYVLPDAFECPQSFVIVTEVERLAALKLTYHVPAAGGGGLRQWRESYLLQARRAAPKRFEAHVPWVQDLKQLAANDPDVGMPELLRLEAIDLVVATASPNWPDHLIDTETLALPDVVSNVENGVGFVGGIVSKRLAVPVGVYREEACLE